jgi:hypothetical protein
MKRIGVLIGLLLCVAAGQARAVGSLADVTIYDRTSGGILPVYHADGSWYVAGRTGNEYEVHIRNNSGGDLLAVVSVDGVNVVTGQTASTGQGGYVVGAAQSVSIQGWRKSLARVAAFYFTDHSDAYATRTGRPDEVGVIGVAVFRRQAQPPAELGEPQVRKEAPNDDRLRPQAPYDAPARSEVPSRSDGGGADASAERAARAVPPTVAEQSIGTGHGRSQTSHARFVSFERESDTPSEVIVLRYDTRANLVARGVIRSQQRDPNPFPARFVPDPPRRW